MENIFTLSCPSKLKRGGGGGNVPGMVQLNLESLKRGNARTADETVGYLLANCVMLYGLLLLRGFIYAKHFPFTTASCKHPEGDWGRW